MFRQDVLIDWVEQLFFRIGWLLNPILSLTDDFDSMFLIDWVKQLVLNRWVAEPYFSLQCTLLVVSRGMRLPDWPASDDSAGPDRHLRLSKNGRFSRVRRF